MASVGQMSLAASRVPCYTYRHLPRGQKRATYKQISKLVKKTDGTRPAEGALAEAVETFMKEKKPRGRKEGQKKDNKRGRPNYSANLQTPPASRMRR